MVLLVPSVRRQPVVSRRNNSLYAVARLLARVYRCLCHHCSADIYSCIQRAVHDQILPFKQCLVCVLEENFSTGARPGYPFPRQLRRLYTLVYRSPRLKACLYAAASTVNNATTARQTATVCVWSDYQQWPGLTRVHSDWPPHPNGRSYNLHERLPRWRCRCNNLHWLQAMV